MIGSLASAGALKAMARGLRLPGQQAMAKFIQQSRTIDAIARLGVDLVLDVGANRGFYSQHLRTVGYRGTILAFEPEPTAFAELQRRAAGDADWHCFNFALGDADAELSFNVIRTGEETVLSSLLPFTGGEIDTTVHTVPVRRLDGLGDLLPAGRTIFLKMDTQGYDLRVFAGAAGVPRIRLLQSEISVVPLYEGMPHFTESLAAYEAAGFTLMDLFVVNRTEGGGVLEFDCLMERAAAN